jgi:putative ABC transport system permease protein
MVKHYFKLARRNLLKNKSFSLINILGLAIGIAACMIIFLYVQNELTYDQYNVNTNRIARVSSTVHTPESDILLATTPIPLADALKRDYPEVEATVRIEAAPRVVKSNNQVFREEFFYSADQNIFSIFSFEFVEGKPEGALQHPNSIVITKTIAWKYFGTRSVLGKTLMCNEKNLIITGVIRDRPINSDIPITALLSVDYSKSTSWMDDFPLYTFVLFKNKPSLKSFEAKMVSMSKKYVQPEIAAMGDGKYSVDFVLTPLADVHFTVGKLADTPKGNKQFNYIFSLLAVFILVIALLNYINLSTAKSTERAKEVGIRKVSGAQQFQLIRQFLFESSFIVAIAWICALGMVWMVLPFFNNLFDTKLAINWEQDIFFILGLFLLTLILAGIYPSFVLSGFKPIKVLKGNWKHGIKGVLLRKTVTITQFAIATGLIMGTTVIYHQMKFIEEKNLGFEKDQLLNIFLPRDSAYNSAVHAFQNELHQRPEVAGITVGSGMMEDGLTIGTTFAETEGKKRELMSNYFSIDPSFLPVFQIHLLEGRNLSDSFGTDKNEAFLVNEAFIKTMGWKSPLGKSMEGFGHKGKVVGVVKNFYYKSLHNIVEPLVLIYNNAPANTTTARIKPKDLAVVEMLFKKNFPALPFDYSFFDDIVNKQYKKDRATMSLFNYFTMLAIFVSCMGLYGLVSLIVIQRTKEISIRKVLGASLNHLITLLTKDFISLVFFALVIALPIAGFAMNKWLNSYAYHIQLSWWMFLIPVILILIIALTIISKEIIRTALANPIKSLRAE